MTEIQKVRRLIFRELRKLDFRPGAPSFRVGMVVMSIFMVGSKLGPLSELSGESEALCGRVVARCRKAGIVRGGKLRVKWEDEQLGWLNIICDVLVATGDITRGCDPKVSVKRAEVRASRKAAGLCGNCGRARDDDKQTCTRCREAVKKSTRQPPKDVTEVQPIRGENWYLHNAHASKRRSTHIGAYDGDRAPAPDEAQSCQARRAVGKNYLVTPSESDT
jgi:hypothetical protein